MRDLLTDILQTLARHPLRTALTAFSVGWGVQFGCAARRRGRLRAQP